MVATKAAAVTGPTLGTVRRRWTRSSAGQRFAARLAGAASALAGAASARLPAILAGGFLGEAACLAGMSRSLLNLRSE